MARVKGHVAHLSDGVTACRSSDLTGAATSRILPTDRVMGMSCEMGAMRMALFAAGMRLSVREELLKNSMLFVLLLLITRGMKAYPRKRHRQRKDTTSLSRV